MAILMQKPHNINKFDVIVRGEGIWKLLRENKIQLFILCIWYFHFTNKGRHTVGTQYIVDCSGCGATGISDTYTALLYELAFTATRSVSGYCCKLSNVELG